MNYHPAHWDGVRVSRSFDSSQFGPVSARRKYAPRRLDYVDRFYAALEKWQSETFLCSSPIILRQHASFREIVALGNLAVPLILAELRKAPSTLVMALAEITGEVPYGPSAKGNLKAMADAWLSWRPRD